MLWRERGYPLSAETSLAEQSRHGVQYHRYPAGVLPAPGRDRRSLRRLAQGPEDLGEELADVAIYLLGLAEMTGVDLRDEIEAKMAKNTARVYQPLPNGVLAKTNGDAD